MRNPGEKVEGFMTEYGNERDVGEALRQSGIPREEVCITTKWSDGDVTPHEACEASLKALGTSYIDVYVIHHTWTCKEDFAGAWRQMEEIRKAGLVRSIGLSACVSVTSSCGWLIEL